MAKSVASSWLEKKSKPEYRFFVMASPKFFASYLRAFRDGKVRIASLTRIPDLGVQESGHGFYVWSSDVNSLRSLKEYFSVKGIETSWIW